jgi:hypothetical protein
VTRNVKPARIKRLNASLVLLQQKELLPVYAYLGIEISAKVIVKPVLGSVCNAMPRKPLMIVWNVEGID